MLTYASCRHSERCCDSLGGGRHKSRAKGKKDRLLKFDDLLGDPINSNY